MSYYDQFTDLQNVGPGKVAVLKVSYNATIDKIHFTLGGGLTKADITLIELKANGNVFYTDTAANLAIRDAYLGVYSEATTLTLDFTETNTRGGAAAQYLASIPRNLLQSLTCELTIGSGANALSTLTAQAVYRDPTANPFILNRKRFTVALPATGDNDLFLPAGDAGGLIKRVWIHHGGNVTKGLIQTNGVPRSRATPTQFAYEQKRNNLTPQANLLVLDFIQDGNLMGMLNTTQYKEVLTRLTTSAADQATVFVDYISDLRRLQ